MVGLLHDLTHQAGQSQAAMPHVLVHHGGGPVRHLRYSTGVCGCETCGAAQGGVGQVCIPIYLYARLPHVVHQTADKAGHVVGWRNKPQ